MPRPFDPNVDQAIATATLELLSELGFARDDDRSGRRRRRRRQAGDLPPLPRQGRAGGGGDRRASCPSLTVPDLGDTRAELWQAVERGFPDDGPAYVGLIGGLMAEHRRHPELIDAFRRSVLLPRRAVGLALVSRGQQRGDIRRDIEPVAAVDLFAGPFLARVFAGEDTGHAWRQTAFAAWWNLVKESECPMIDFTLESHIDRPPAEVFDHVSDPDRLATWQTNTVSAVRRRRPDAGRHAAARGAPRARRQGARSRSSRSPSSSPAASFALRVVEGTPVHLRMTFEPGRRRHAPAASGPTGS